MPKLVSGTAVGPNAYDAFAVVLKNHLIANGWELARTEVDLANNRAWVFRGQPLDPVANNRPVIYFRIGLYGTPKMEVGVLSRGSDSSPDFTLTDTNALMPITDASFDYKIRTNGLAVAITMKIGVNYWASYVGFLRRGLPYSMAGITRANSIPVGSTTINVNSNMVGKLTPGQRVMITEDDYDAPWNGSVTEHVILKEVHPTYLRLMEPTVWNHGSCVIGVDPFPCVVSDKGMNVFYYQFHKDGSNFVTSDTPSYTDTSVFAWSYQEGTNEVAPGLIYASDYDNRRGGWLGWPYHYITIPYGDYGYGDLFTDGDQTFEYVYESGWAVALKVTE